MIVTIDGPAGSGKSTVARELARRLGFEFLDTGATYRAVAYCALREQLPLDDEPALGALARRMLIAFEDGRTLVNGADVTTSLRTPEVTTAASRVAVLPAVRAALVELQRRAAAGGRVVTEGRDQGTVVFPDAECKFFLTADPNERARRRLRDLEQQGVTAGLEEVSAQLGERDARDSARDVAPLKPADDAQILDTTALKLAEVLDELERAVRRQLG